MVINLTRRHETNMAFLNLFRFTFHNINAFKTFKSVKSEIALQKLAMGNRR